MDFLSISHFRCFFHLSIFLISVKSRIFIPINTYFEQQIHCVFSHFLGTNSPLLCGRSKLRKVPFLLWSQAIDRNPSAHNSTLSPQNFQFIIFEMLKNIIIVVYIQSSDLDLKKSKFDPPFYTVRCAVHCTREQYTIQHLVRYN